jgi:Roadblock/LC7 domain
MAEKKGEKGDSMPEVEVLLKGLLSQPGVEGFMVFNNAGIPLKWTPAFNKPGSGGASSNPIPPSVVHHAALISDLSGKASIIARRLLGDEGDVQLLRLRTAGSEMIIAPHEDCTLVVSQKAHSATMTSLLEQPTQVAVAAPAEEAKK